MTVLPAVSAVSPPCDPPALELESCETEPELPTATFGETLTAMPPSDAEDELVWETSPSWQLQPPPLSTATFGEALAAMPPSSAEELLDWLTSPLLRAATL